MGSVVSLPATNYIRRKEYQWAGYPLNDGSKETGGTKGGESSPHHNKFCLYHLILYPFQYLYFYIRLSLISHEIRILPLVPVRYLGHPSKPSFNRHFLDNIFLHDARKRTGITTSTSRSSNKRPKTFLRCAQPPIRVKFVNSMICTSCAR